RPTLGSTRRAAPASRLRIAGDARHVAGDGPRPAWQSVVRTAARAQKSGADTGPRSSATRAQTGPQAHRAWRRTPWRRRAFGLRGWSPAPGETSLLRHPPARSIHRAGAPTASRRDREPPAPTPAPRLK